MFLLRVILNWTTFLTTAIALVAVAGDYLTSKSALSLVKALCDNMTHALIGGLSWLIVWLNRNRGTNDARGGFVEVLSCLLISSLIDLDHFFAAKSLKLSEATKLAQRPPLHCSTLPIVVCLFLLSLSYPRDSYLLKQGALILLTAFATHHIRDGTRRGLWFYPFGSTPALPYLLYIILVCLVPYVIILMDKCWFIEKRATYSDGSQII